MSEREAPFVRQRKVLRLVFEDEYDGLVVRMRSLSIGELLDFDRLQSGDGDISEVLGLLDLAASKIISWNLVNEDGTPVPTTTEALRAEDPDFIMLLIRTWMRQAVHGVRGTQDRDDAPGESPPPDSGVGMGGAITPAELSQILASASQGLPEGLGSGSASEPS